MIDLENVDYQHLNFNGLIITFIKPRQLFIHSSHANALSKSDVKYTGKVIRIKRRTIYSKIYYTLYALKLANQEDDCVVFAAASTSTILAALLIGLLYKVRLYIFLHSYPQIWNKKRTIVRNAILYLLRKRKSRDIKAPVFIFQKPHYEHSKIYQDLTKEDLAKFEFLPHPTERHIEIKKDITKDPRKRPGGVRRLVFIGSPRPEKNFYGFKTCELKGVKKVILSAARFDNSLIWQKADGDIRRDLFESDIVYCGYDEKFYEFTQSGVLLDAISAGCWIYISEGMTGSVEDFGCPFRSKPIRGGAIIKFQGTQIFRQISREYERFSKDLVAHPKV